MRRSIIEEPREEGEAAKDPEFAVQRWRRSLPSPVLDVKTRVAKPTKKATIVKTSGKSGVQKIPERAPMIARSRQTTRRRTKLRRKAEHGPVSFCKYCLDDLVEFMIRDRGEDKRARSDCRDTLIHLRSLQGWKHLKWV